MTMDQAKYPPSQPANYQPPPPPGQQLPPGYDTQHGYPQQQPIGNQPQYGYPQQQPIGNQPTNTTVVVAAPVGITGANVCAFCGGDRKERFTLVGLVFACLFFPVGIICCFLMTEKRCSSCGR